MAHRDVYLETDRLIIRSIVESDFDDLYALDSDPVVMKHIAPPRDEQFIRDRMHTIWEYYEKHPGMGSFYVATRDGTFVGYCALVNMDHTEEIEIGYRLMVEQWGKGYATEIACALRDHGFHTVGLERIVGIAAHDNTASQRTLEKTGMVYEKDAVFYKKKVKYYAIEK